MSFGQPWFLLGLLAVPLLGGLLALHGRRQQRARERFAEPSLLARMGLGPEPRLIRWKAGLLLGAVTLLILTAARPQGGVREEATQGQGIDLMIALDGSQSMLARDGEAGSRLLAAQDFIRSLLHELASDRVGLIAFAGEAVMVCPFTTDYGTLLTFLSDLDTDTLRQPGTSLGEAIRLAAGCFPEGDGRGRKGTEGEGRGNWEIRKLGNRAAKQGKLGNQPRPPEPNFLISQLPSATLGTSGGRVLLLLSDGEDHDTQSLAAARAVRDKGLIIHTIGVGRPTGAKIPVGRDLWDRPVYKSYHGQEVITRLHEETLQRIAALTGGLYLHATNSRAVETLQRSLRTLKKKAIRGHTVTFRRELFQGFLLGAIFLLALESVFPSRLQRTRRRETIA